MKIINDSLENINKEIVNVIEKKIKSIKKDKIAIGIPGGNSVSGIFSELLKRDINWKKIHLFMIDERITKNKKELNFNLARDGLFNSLVKENKLKEGNVHPFIFTEDIKKDVFNYTMDLTRISYKFDIIIVSAGEDGHIASLFPNHPSIKDSAMGYIHVKNSPKLPPERISASRATIKESDTAILLFFGESKKDALKNFMNKKISYEDCPAKIISEIKDSYVFTDLKLNNS